MGWLPAFSTARVEPDASRGACPVRRRLAGVILWDLFRLVLNLLLESNTGVLSDGH